MNNYTLLRHSGITIANTALSPHYSRPTTHVDRRHLMTSWPCHKFDRSTATAPNFPEEKLRRIDRNKYSIVPITARSASATRSVISHHCSVCTRVKWAMNYNLSQIIKVKALAYQTTTEFSLWLWQYWWLEWLSYNKIAGHSCTFIA